MPSPHEVRRATTPVLAVITAIIGVALVIRMAIIGNPIGVVLGLLFIAAGGGRLYIARKGA